MSELDQFLRESAALAGVDTSTLLARVLHVNDNAVHDVITAMSPTTQELLLKLDRELRLRNPGLHYVVRKMFLGYRREGGGSAPLGERSQIFVSVMRVASRLEVVVPVDADSMSLPSNARDLRGTGHHGVGDVRVAINTHGDLDDFLRVFDFWLRTPR